MTKFSIAIDGPAGAGKSTIAKNLARELNCIYIDTGAMYRAVGLYCINHQIDYTDEELVTRILPELSIDIHYTKGVQTIHLNNEDVSISIRTQEVASAASKVATYAEVRSALVAMQRKMQSTTSVVMDGRDIGTVVLPNATLKIFLTASASERAHRRCKEYEDKGIESNFEEILKEIKERDYQDSHREVSPLKKADDAVEIDTTYLTIDGIADQILELLKERI